jgi:hypothetical protein
MQARTQEQQAPAADFLQLLGKDPAETWFRIIRHKKDGTRHPRGGADLHGLDLEALSRDNANGWSVYYVSGNASTATSVHKRTGRPSGAVWEGDITSCPAVFAEWDDKPIEWQLNAWRVLGLPEPSVMVLSGGKSVHCYWRLTEPMAPDQWRVLQSRLVDHCGSDQKCKDPCRVMRLPGFQYINKTTNEPTGQTADVVHTSGKTYTAAELESCLPSVLQPVAPAPAAAPPPASTGSSRPRTLQEIQAAAQYIPQRVVGGNTYETCRRALCGCAAALAEIGLPEQQALDLLASKWPSRGDAEQALNSSTTRNAASFWNIAREHGYNLSRKASKPAKVVELHPRQQQAGPARSAEKEPQPSPPPQAQPQERPFRILGWSTKMDAIWVQTGKTGTVASIPPTKNGLQRIAPLPYWETLYPSKTGPGWDAAISSICEQAEDLGQIFTPDRIRGRGVWLDNNRVVWHLGNRIEVDGQLQPLTALRDTGWTYASLPALEIDPSVAPLTDAEGSAILDLIHNRMQWENPGDGLLIAGHAVQGNICGALDIRPGLQLTGPSRGGKSTTERTISRPLQGGLGVRPSGATEAGIKQKMHNDALPVVIDESEQESPKVREGHLRLLRLSFDGQEQVKGTAGGQAITYTMRSSITLIGINATVPNLADRNRLVVIRPRKMPPTEWTAFQLQRNALITVETGRRLIRRSVSNLKALVANIKTFQAVVAGQGLGDRSAEVYGSLLASAHHLTSTAVLAPAEALSWLDSMGWSGIDKETEEAIASDAEGRACLDHLLGHSVPWKGTQTGAVDVRELLAIVKNNPKAEEAVKALGRLGVKLDRERGLVVSNACRIFTGTRWANGAHRDRLLEITGSDRVPAAVWFSGGGAHKAVAIPLEHVALTEATA